MPRRRFQRGQVYQRGNRWVGSYREYDVNPDTGKRTRRTITFDATVTSERAAWDALQPYLDQYNNTAKAEANLKPSAVRKTGKTVSDLTNEWKKDILPNYKLSGARAALSHIRTYIIPLLGEKPLHELDVREHQAFVTAVGRRANRKKTVINVYVTLSSILNTGRGYHYVVPEVRRKDLKFLVDEKPKAEQFFFDADTAARIINVAPYPFKLMFLIAALCGLRIGEVTALKVSNIDFKRKSLSVTGALDYATRKETTPKSDHSAASLHMPELLAKHLRDWIEKHYVPNADGYLFTNSKGKPYLSDNVVKYGVHRAMANLGIVTTKGVHIGIHCFRHGVTSELLESGTPIHVVTKLMRHADSKVTLEHYAHIVGDAERVASEKFSQRIGQNISQLDSDCELDSTSATKTA